MCGINILDAAETARRYIESDAGANGREIYEMLKMDTNFVERAQIQKSVRGLTSEQISAIQMRLRELAVPEQSAFMAESWERIAARERGDFIEEEEACMNELGNEKTMSVKEVADVLGVTPEAIKKHVREMYPEILRDGITTYLNEEQVTAIKQKMMPTTQVVGALTSLDIERMTLQVIEYHVSVNLKKK
jgi:predicted transcriptional regulator